MIEAQDWLAPLLGSVFLVAIPLIVGLMCNTVVNRMRSNDIRAHEHRLDRKTLPNRKDDERARLKTVEQWDRIESYTRTRNLCFLVALAVVEVNAGLILVALTANSAILSVSILVVLVVLFAAAIRAALRKPKRPVWVTTPGYYRDLAVGNTRKRQEDPA